MLARQVLFAHTSPLQPVTAVRSTILQMSVNLLRDHGHGGRYLELVDPTYRATILESIVPTWLSLQVADAHYRACDALALSDNDQLAMGKAMGDRIQATYLATLMKTAKASGLSPMVLFSRFDRAWPRAFQGGSLQLTQVGPKDVVLEVRGAQLTRYSYFRRAFVGVVRAALQLGGTRAEVVKEAGFRENADVFTIAGSWV